MFHLEAKNAGTKYLLNKITEDLIVFRHSHIAITNYRMGDNFEFEKSLSIFDKINYRYEFIGGYYVKPLQELRINRGYNIHRLKEYFPNRRIVVDNDAYPYDEVKVKLYTPPKNDFQKVALAFMAAEGDFKRNVRFTQLMVDADTGMGKTYCGTASTAFLSAKTVIIVPLAKLVDQWKESFTNFTSIKEEEILTVQGSKICEEIRMGKHEDKKAFIFVVNTITSYNKRYGDINTMDMLSATRAYTKIVDEIHLDMKAIAMIEAMSNFRMNYYMSASPGRTDRKENWMFKTLFFHVPRFGGKFKTKTEKHLNIMVKRYYFTPTEKQIRRMVNNKVGLNGKAYEGQLMNAFPVQKQSFEQSLRTIVTWALKQLKDGNKIMILGQSIEFLKYIKSCIDDLDPSISLYYGGMKKKEKPIALEHKIIVATTSSLGTGADIKGLQFVINCSTYSSWVMVTQVSGRLRQLPDGTPTIYIELVNFGYNKTIRQYENRVPHLLKRSKDNKIIMVN